MAPGFCSPEARRPQAWVRCMLAQPHQHAPQPRHATTSLSCQARTREDAVAAARLHVELVAAHAAVPHRQRQQLRMRGGRLPWHAVQGGGRCMAQACSTTAHPALCGSPPSACRPAACPAAWCTRGRPGRARESPWWAPTAPAQGKKAWEQQHGGEQGWHLQAGPNPAPPGARDPAHRQLAAVKADQVIHLRVWRVEQGRPGAVCVSQPCLGLLTRAAAVSQVGSPRCPILPIPHPSSRATTPTPAPRLFVVDLGK